jgi:transcriptional regulator with XRE-family HTH domain
MNKTICFSEGSDNINTTIGKKVRSIRQANGISQIALAKKAGIAQSTLSYIENGRKNPQFETLAAICKALNISMLELLTYNEPDIGFKLFEQDPRWQNVLSRNAPGVGSEAMTDCEADTQQQISALERYLFSQCTQQEHG